VPLSPDERRRLLIQDIAVTYSGFKPLSMLANEAITGIMSEPRRSDLSRSAGLTDTSFKF